MALTSVNAQDTLSKSELVSTYCDGFAQSIKLWSQETPLLGKHVQKKKKHAANNTGAVISVVRTTLVATQRALNTSQQ
jgi:hypothetical protein